VSLISRPNVSLSLSPSLPWFGANLATGQHVSYGRETTPPSLSLQALRVLAKANWTSHKRHRNLPPRMMWNFLICLRAKRREVAEVYFFRDVGIQLGRRGRGADGGKWHFPPPHFVVFAAIKPSPKEFHTDALCRMPFQRERRSALREPRRSDGG